MNGSGPYSRTLSFPTTRCSFPALSATLQTSSSIRSSSRSASSATQTWLAARTWLAVRTAASDPASGTPRWRGQSSPPWPMGRASPPSGSGPGKPSIQALLQRRTMPDVHITFAMTPYDRVLPLITGEVKPAGITLEYQGMPGAVPGVFYDQLKFQRYDLSEMSFSSFLVERAKGWPYRLLPVFHNRNFSYTNVVIRRSSGIRQDHPEDLKGKRFAVGDYQQTAALWIRGVLQHEFGVTPQDMEWVQTRGEHYSHTGASGTKPPVKLTYANAAESDLFLRGEIDASMSWGGESTSALARDGTDIRGNPEFCTLFSDPKAEAIRYYRK